MNAKQRYREICVERGDIGLFQNVVWLDAIAPSNWNVVLAVKGKEVLGAMPFFQKRKLGFDIITMPPLTPYLGPVLFYPVGQKPSTRLSFEKEIIQLLIAQLPKTDKFIQYFLPSFQNGLPFQWAGFDQSVRYTYVLSETFNINKCWDGLQGNIRRAIKKAEQEFTIEIADNSELLFQLKTEDYEEKKLELEFENSYLEDIYRALNANQIGQIIMAKDNNGNVSSAILLGWDSRSVHYISGALKPEFRSSGALSLLLWKGIQMASEKGLQFNFEGGMIESIEKYFRGFGAEPAPYFEVSKIDSKLLNLL